jgi:tetratricopeptide (TPR) repeat protein
MRRVLLFIFLISASSVCFSQNIDSLWKVYNDKTKADTNRLKAINIIAWSYNSNNPDTAIILAEEVLKLAIQTKRKKYEGAAFNSIGASYMNKDNYPKALEYYLKSLKIYEEILSSDATTENVGRETKKRIGTCYINIGLVYLSQSNYQNAQKYYVMALKKLEEINDKKGTGACYSNLGIVCAEQFNYPKALEYYFKALKIRQEVGDKQGIAACFTNIGNVYYNEADYLKSLEFYQKSLQVNEEEGDKQGIGTCYINIAGLYNKLANYKLAIQCCNAALNISKEIGNIDNERLAYQNFAEAYSKTGRYKEAYENHVKFKQLTDSIFNADNSKQLGDLKTQFEVEKKEAELKIKSDAEQEKLKAIALEEKKRQQVIIASAVGVLLVVIMFSLFLYKRFRITQRQKTIIEKQKQRVDEAYSQLHERNKEVMDSIHYAKRIQTALITSEKYFDTTLNRLMKK